MAERGKGKARGLNPEQWAELRKAYEGGESILGLSKRFGVRRETIGNRRDREAWTVGLSGHVSGRADSRVVQERAQAKVIDIATGRAVDAMIASGVVDDIGRDLAETLRRHGSISRKLTNVVDLYLSTALGEKAEFENDLGEIACLGITPSEKQNHADVLNALVAGVKGALAITREVAGLKPGQSSNIAGNDIAEPTVIVRKVVRPARESVG